MPITLEQLRAHAVRQSLFNPTTLKAAIKRLGFVQADPIRSPARAQDLILRHRVKNYRAGDLERLYPKLDIEEDVLYAYGFLPRSNWRLLHPRSMKDVTEFEREVFGVVHRFGQMHPRELEAHLGRERAVNAWGGYSKATTRALEALHYRGLLRIVGREQGIRIYEEAPAPPEPLSPSERIQRLVLLLAGIFAPVPLVSLRAMVSRLRYAAPGLDRKPAIIGQLVRSGELNSAEVDGLIYIWAGRMKRANAPTEVRLLAPFDPVVWDRRRLEHLWGWRYRFEAYTPVAKRKLGYYAMPLLWGDQIVGWANVSVAKGSVKTKLGWIGGRPKGPEFAAALEAEIARMQQFLNS